MKSNTYELKIKSIFNLAFLFAISAFLFACESGEPLEIYNPYMNTITVAIGEEEEPLQVSANSFKDVHLEVGQHAIKVTLNDEVILDDSITLTAELIESGSFLNLTKQELIIYEETYGDEYYNMLQENSILSDKYEEMQNELDEPFFEFFMADELVIKKDWKYSINESFPETVEISSNQSHVKYKKLFTYDNFVKYAEEMAEESY